MVLNPDEDLSQDVEKTLQQDQHLPDEWYTDLSLSKDDVDEFRHDGGRGSWMWWMLILIRFVHRISVDTLNNQFCVASDVKKKLGVGMVVKRDVQVWLFDLLSDQEPLQNLDHKAWLLSFLKGDDTSK